MEWGDDVKAVSEDEAMVLVNHQATGDVCTLMMCLQDKGTVGCIWGRGWLLCVLWSLRTHFGLVTHQTISAGSFLFGFVQCDSQELGADPERCLWGRSDKS